MSSSIDLPIWFREICTRLEDDDELLQNLNLNIRQLDATMMEILSNAIMKSNNLFVLNLVTSVAMNRDDPMNALYYLYKIVISNHESLRILHLSYNNITSHGLDVLGTALSMNQSLIELYLDYNSITTTGGIAIASGLQKNYTLRLLSLNNNNISDDGTMAMAQVLGTNDTLHTLNLQSNGITKVGYLALRRALEPSTNYTLRECRLDANEDDNNNNNNTNEREWVELFCKANRIGRSVIARKECVALFPQVLTQAAKGPLTTQAQVISLHYILLRNHLYE